MRNLELAPSKQDLTENLDALRSNEYPGRLILAGINAIGDTAIQAYALTGRSESSQDRVLEVDSYGGIQATAFSKSAEEMAETEQAALLYYPAMKNVSGVHMVSNGAQTEPALWNVLKGNSLDEAMKDAPVVDGVYLGGYEPDEPNFTPRIASVFDLRKDDPSEKLLSIASVRNAQDMWIEGNYYRQTYTESVKDLPKGVGYIVQTYNGDGTPLPSFDKRPYGIEIGDNEDDVANMLWQNLNTQNRVAVVAKAVHLEAGDTSYHIINKHTSSNK